MEFISKLFKKNNKDINKNAFYDNREFDELSEEEKLQSAAEFIRANAEAGDAEHQYLLGVMFMTGKGPYGHGSYKKDHLQAKKWLVKSAEQGYADGQFALGKLYEQSGDIDSAIKYIAKAATQNHVQALIELAMAYGSGEGVEQDRRKAHDLFFSAANLNDPFAQFIVGRNFFYGDGVEQNSESAVKWYMKSAEQGEEHAQLEMGKIFEFGGDLVKAKKWFEKAAAQGNEEAQQKLREL